MGRRRWLLAGAASVVVLVAGVTTAYDVAHHHEARTSGSGNTLRGPVGEGAEAPGKPRPLVYAEGRTIHLGAKTIDTGHDLLSLDVTDDGAAFTTFNGGVWFTDGSTIERVGTTSPGQVVARGVEWGPAGRPKDWVVSDPAGSRMAWFEYDQDELPEIVVYDTHERRDVARLPIELDPDCARCPRILSVDTDIYWTDTPMRGLGTNGVKDRSRIYRYSVATHSAKSVSLASYRSRLLRRQRTLVVGDTWASGTVSDGIGRRFSFTAPGSAGVGAQVFDAVSGRPVAFHPPPGYVREASARLYIFEWLDDDRVALMDATGWGHGDYGGEDLLVCHVDTGGCAVAVRRPRADPSPILPEFESRGDGFAEARAVRLAIRLIDS